MQYLLMLYSDESRWSAMSAEQQQQGVAAYMAYRESLAAAGVLAGSNRLRPATTATTLHAANNKVQVLDGPFVDSKEELGGYFLIDVPDLDAALSWASKCPAVDHGSVEVRAIWASAGTANAAPVPQEAVASR
ncbi:MAG TPA: YciI family protein [Terracidiphilus sp.]|jgi:hypothetical protein